MTYLEITAAFFISLATLMSLFRLLFGPSNADRIVSADALSLIATIVLVLLALVFNSIFYLDVAMIYAVLSFVGIVVLAQLLESKNRKGED
jgi:multicomponent Na+:H+ antiporter subunit F